MDAKFIYHLAELIPKTGEKFNTLSIFYKDDGTVQFVTFCRHGVKNREESVEVVNGVNVYIESYEKKGVQFE